MIVGFTGSRDVPTHKQIQSLVLLLKHLGVTELHHGDCEGSDEAAHYASLEHHAEIHIHPPEIDTVRAFCEGATYLYTPEPYIDRNHCIVDKTEATIGMPNTHHEKMRSGTWSALRYAKKMSKPTYIVWPEGSVTKGWGRSAEKVRL